MAATEQEVQTVIQCRTLTKSGTQLSPGENAKFFSLLEYLPNERIQQGNERILNTTKTPVIINVSPLSALTLSRQDVLLLDDDALSEVCLEIKKRMEYGRMTVHFDEKETQTRLHVTPHVLQNEEVAVVLADAGVQTETIVKKANKK